MILFLYLTHFDAIFALGDPINDSVGSLEEFKMFA